MSQDGPSSGGSGERVCVACGSRYPQGTRFCPSDGQALREDAASDESLVGQVIADRYYIEKRLGVGGMGVVYLAQQVLISRRCAIKVLRPEFLKSADALGRFARGAQSAAQIVHPNVATVFDFGEVDGESMYLAMEYVDGDSLGAILEKESYLTLTKTLVIVAQIASALKAAHDLGIVHRDLKPENIMFARTASGDVVKVVDFGIARAIVDDAQQVTDSKAIIGTPAYMSPEQISGGLVDQRSDLYSLALVICEMLTGKLPLSSERSEIVMRFLQNPRTLQELMPEVRWSGRLQEVLGKALAVNPEDRHKDITEFGRDFMDACRSWRPGDSADAVGTLSALGMSLSLALSSEAIVSIATPVPQRAVVVTSDANVSGRSRTWSYLTIGAVLAAVVLLVVSQPWRSGDAVPNGAAPPVAEKVDSTSLPLAAAPLTVQTADSAVPPKVEETPPIQKKTEVAQTRRQETRSPAPPPKPAIADSTRPQTITLEEAAQDSPVVVPPPPEPATGMIRIGSRKGALLIIGNELKTGVRSLQAFSVPARENVRIRLRLDSCQDWDSTVVVRGGQSLDIGFRDPTCPPQ
jgi:serine/threonine protein kinase